MAITTDDHAHVFKRIESPERLRRIDDFTALISIARDDDRLSYFEEGQRRESACDARCHGKQTVCDLVGAPAHYPASPRFRPRDTILENLPSKSGAIPGPPFQNIA